MIFLQGWAHSPSLHFPAEYDLALPRRALTGGRPQMVLLLHGLGSGREEWIHSVRLETLTEEYGLALVLPEGRRSCFLDMREGPCWNAYLREDLIPALRRQLCLSDAPPAVIGLDSGALGALQLASNAGLFCAAIDPDSKSPFVRQPSRWPLETEWAGVFEGGEADWRKENFADVRGVVVGEPQLAKDFRNAFGLESWEERPAPGADLEQKLRLALTAFRSRLTSTR